MADQELTNATTEEGGGEDGTCQVMDGEAGNQQDEPDAKQDEMVLLTAKKEKDPFPKQNHLAKQVCLYNTQHVQVMGAAWRLYCGWIGIRKEKKGRLGICD